MEEFFFLYQRYGISNVLSINLLSIAAAFDDSSYFTTLAARQVKNTVLFDASLAYHFENGVQISINARNLLNQQTYAYSVYNGLQEFSCMYRIRPLNILATVFFNF